MASRRRDGPGGGEGRLDEGWWTDGMGVVNRRGRGGLNVGIGHLGVGRGWS